MDPSTELDIFRILKPQQGPSISAVEDLNSLNKLAKKRVKKVRSLSLSAIESGERRDSGISESAEITTTAVSVLSQETNDNESGKNIVGKKDEGDENWWWWWEPKDGSLLLDFCRQTVRRDFYQYHTLISWPRHYNFDRKIINISFIL